MGINTSKKNKRMFELNGNKITEIDLGEMILGQEYEFQFQYTGKGNVQKVAGCGCMSPSYDSKTKTITGKYKANWGSEPNKEIFNKTLSLVMDVPVVLDLQVPSAGGFESIKVNDLDYTLTPQGKYARTNLKIKIKGIIREA